MQAVLTFVQQQDVIVKEITTEPVADFYPCEFIRQFKSNPCYRSLYYFVQAFFLWAREPVENM